MQAPPFSEDRRDLRWVAYGYRYGEVALPDLPEVLDAQLLRTEAVLPDPGRRPPMMVSMGPILLGDALPHPDQSDRETLLAGVTKRMMGKMPKASKPMLKKLKKFAKNWLEQHCTPLSPDSDLSFEKWIESRPYPEWRKQELRQTYESMVKGGLPKEYRKVKLFMKDECYGEYKHARGIYARCDEFKILFGPLVSAMEDDMYKNPEFIKYVPVVDRLIYIEELLQTSTELDATTDYKSFEMSFVEEIMRALDRVMFKFYTKYLDCKLYADIIDSLMDWNVIINKFFVFLIKARRMSGEMNTSLSNGFANLMVNKFLCLEKGCGEIRIVVEGDDGRMKSATGRYPTPADYEELGFNIKIEIHADGNRASFCGIVYDRDERINVTDPREVLASFGWATQRYARARKGRLLDLLRSKALCFLHQYPGAPVIQSLAEYGLRMTRSRDIRHFVKNDRTLSNWEREQFQAALDNRPIARPVGPNTRILVEEMYGLSVETQIQIENYLARKTDLSAIECDFESNIDHVHYFNNYCRQVAVSEDGFYTFSVPDNRSLWANVGSQPPP